VAKSKPTPCDNCPFTFHGIKVNVERIEEFDDNMRKDMHFHCHKSVDHAREDDDGEYISSGDETLCAGYEILMIREYGGPSQMARIASRLGFLDIDALYKHLESKECKVFDSMSEALDIHENC